MIFTWTQFKPRKSFTERMKTANHTAAAMCGISKQARNRFNFAQTKENSKCWWNAHTKKSPIRSNGWFMLHARSFWFIKCMHKLCTTRLYMFSHQSPTAKDLPAPPHCYWWWRQLRRHSMYWTWTTSFGYEQSGVDCDTKWNCHRNHLLDMSTTPLHWFEALMANSRMNID